eukprot:GEMP01013200.1.p1 GENE.GEMP01013200.1~~GEMP01013200.1.p1  ORF type:complete len:734 (+),score=147.64 GEMP01013200.1:389-2590(+)
MLQWQGSVVAAELKTPAGERSVKTCRTIAKALATVPGTQNFVEEARIFIAQKLTTREIPAHTRLFDIGDVGHHLYIVLSGWLAVEVWVGCREGHASYKECPCTDKQLKRVSGLDPGSSFGEVALQKEGCPERTARVVTVERSTLIELSRKDYWTAKLMCPVEISQDILAYLLTVEGGLLSNRSDVTERDLFALVQHFVAESYHGREVICRETREADRMVFIKNGFCKVVRSFVDPRRTRHGYITPYDASRSTAGTLSPVPQYTIDIGLTAVVDSFIEAHSRECDDEEENVRAVRKPVRGTGVFGVSRWHYCQPTLLHGTSTTNGETPRESGRRVDHNARQRSRKQTNAGLLTSPKGNAQFLSMQDKAGESTDAAGKGTEETKRRERLEDILTHDMVVVDNLRPGRTYGLLEILECTTFKNSLVADPTCQIYSIKKLALLRYAAKGIVHALFCHYKSDLTDECLMERRVQRARWDKFKRDLMSQINGTRRTAHDMAHTRRDQMPSFVPCAPVRGSSHVSATTSKYISARLGAHTMTRLGTDGLLWGGKAVTPPRTPYNDMQRKSGPTNALDIYTHRAEGQKVEIRMVKPESKSVSMFAMERKIVASISATRHFLSKKRIRKAKNRGFHMIVSAPSGDEECQVGGKYKGGTSERSVPDAQGGSAYHNNVRHEKIRSPGGRSSAQWTNLARRRAHMVGRQRQIPSVRNTMTEDEEASEDDVQLLKDAKSHVGATVN